MRSWLTQIKLMRNWWQGQLKERVAAGIRKLNLLCGLFFFYKKLTWSPTDMYSHLFLWNQNKRKELFKLCQVNAYIFLSEDRMSKDKVLENPLPCIGHFLTLCCWKVLHVGLGDFLFQVFTLIIRSHIFFFSYVDTLSEPHSSPIVIGFQRKSCPSLKEDFPGYWSYLLCAKFIILAVKNWDEVVAPL